MLHWTGKFEIRRQRIGLLDSPLLRKSTIRARAACCDRTVGAADTGVADAHLGPIKLGPGAGDPTKGFPH